MSKKAIAVVFSHTGARVFVGPAAHQVAKQPNVVINPDLSKVRGLPPHKWELKAGKVVPVSASTAKKREKVLHADQKPTHLQLRLYKKYFPTVILAFFLGMAVSQLLARLF